MTTKKQNPKAATSGSGKVIRVAALTNPKTKRPIFERVTRDGKLSARAAERLGAKRVKAWIEVAATSWAAATAAVKAGKGKKMSA
jgi:hypothetical protein